MSAAGRMGFRGRRVTVMGLGRFGGGVAAAGWLADQGAMVTVTDLATDSELAEALDALRGHRIARFHLGGHREEDFRSADLVVVNPAVRPGNPFLEMVIRHGVPRTTEVELFLRRCPTPVIGVTGTNGKSTTAAMIASILRASGQPTWLGGNIGASLLGELDRMGPEGWTVLELSSFQLWHMDPSTTMPQIAVVTGCCANHLDWHGDYEHYAAAKQKMLIGQRRDSLAVLNPAAPELGSWRRLVRGRVASMFCEAQVPALRVDGRHNRLNARLAATAAQAAGCDEAAILQGLERFPGLPGRLEMVAVIEGRRFYNDTTATTPGSTVAALESVPGPVWLVAGGSDKGIDLSPLAEAVVRHAAGAAFFGATGGQLAAAVAQRQVGLPCRRTETLSQALGWCWERSRPRDAILFSPGCASRDQFTNYVHRGRHFMELIRQLADPRRR